MGATVGYLTVLRPAPNKGQCTAWLCKCRCGKEIIMTTGSLRSGLNKSCGCYRATRNRLGNVTHGLSSERLYRLWIGMRSRCGNPRNSAYHNYGARGIMVCREWQNDFPAFYSWAVSHGYKDQLTIERKDYNGNYEPENCTWIPKPEQSYNLRTNRLITCNGITKSIREWSLETGISVGAIKGRIDTMKWSVEDALRIPIQKRTRVAA